MRRYRHSEIVLVFATVLLSLSLGTQHRLLAQDYGGGGGMGTSVLSFDPQGLAVKQGGSASAKMTVKRTSGRTWGTSLQAAALPTGMTVIFDPASGNPTFTSTMAVKVTSEVAPGGYIVRFGRLATTPRRSRSTR